ncbi:hypothetical protein SAMN05720781_0345 [Fibrobacter sp. UWT3]|uniref:hypothetical protein n=1 Tax=Fibrobacter sp. UWT3 TaxID=1896225 RepID=UPI000BC5259D|nr:hypothetical protein [Fibrobacter sp. UWT3]SOE49528.1 hypothetical protein SAMN05720781_0345 [Fibrobacter sp. UWT3]
MQKRKKKKIIGIAVAACVVAAVVFAVLYARGASADEKPHETRPLFDVLDSANMMLVTPVGLGDRAKGRVISGRTYQNFVQLLRLADAKETLLDTFHTECATGVRVQLFYDTLSVAELRIAEKIGRVGDDTGVWVPEKPVTMGKVNVFLRNQGVKFRPCPIGTAEVSGEPDFALDGMILERDTALSTPLYDLLKDSERAVVRFSRIVMPKNLADKKNKIEAVQGLHKRGNVELDSSQLQELLSLLRTPKRESFSGGCLCFSRATISFYQDSVNTFRLHVIGSDYGTFEKHNLLSDVGASGLWESANPQALRAFFDRIRAPLEEAERGKLPIETPVLILK